MNRLPLMGIIVGSVLSTSVLAATSVDKETLRAQGRFTTAALNEARAKVKTTPEDAKAWITLGKYLMRQYDEESDPPEYDEAMKAFEKAIALDASSTFALAYRGVLKGMKAREEDSKTLAKEALKDLDDALAKNPTNTGLLYLNGAVSVEVPRRWGRAADAGERLERAVIALERDPAEAVTYDINMGSAYMKLAKYYREEKKFDRATENWKKAADFDPDSESGKEAKKLIKKYEGAEKEVSSTPPASPKR